jgi:hypothetical protein
METRAQKKRRLLGESMEQPQQRSTRRKLSKPKANNGIFQLFQNAAPQEETFSPLLPSASPARSKSKSKSKSSSSRRSSSRSSSSSRRSSSSSQRSRRSSAAQPFSANTASRTAADERRQRDVQWRAENRDFLQQRICRKKYQNRTQSNRCKNVGLYSQRRCNKYPGVFEWHEGKEKCLRVRRKYGPHRADCPAGKEYNPQSKRCRKAPGNHSFQSSEGRNQGVSPNINFDVFEGDSPLHSSEEERIREAFQGSR